MYALWYDMWRNYAEFWFLGVWGFVLALTRRCIFGKLCREAALGGGSKGKMLRQMTLKFEKSYEVHVEIHDISAFVRKYLYQEKRFGVFLGRWTRLPERWGRLTLYTGTAEGLILYFQGNDPLFCLDRALTAALAALAVQTAVLVFESDSLWARAENSLRDYVANTLYPRQHHEYEGFEAEAAAGNEEPGQAAVPDASGHKIVPVKAGRNAAPGEAGESDAPGMAGQKAVPASDLSTAPGARNQVQKDGEKGVVLEKEEEQLFREVLSDFLGSST